MSDLPIDCLRTACRLFMDLAYPGGPDTIPAKKRPYYDLSGPLADYLPPAPNAAGIAADLAARKQGQEGYEFRLGSASFPHLKLRVHRVDNRGQAVWIYAVDTHDAFSSANYLPPPDHPDSVAWRALQETNAQLKTRIETALEAAGCQTFKSLLKQGLS